MNAAEALPEPKPAKAAKLAAVKPQVKSPGQIAAEALENEAAARRLGLKAEPKVEQKELVEDWMEDAEKARPAAPPELAGLYRVTHGNLWFSPTKVARAGRIVRLEPENARAFIEAGYVTRVGD